MAGGQAATAGMMPSSDSDSDAEPAPPPKPKAPEPAGQVRTPKLRKKRPPGEGPQNPESDLTEVGQEQTIQTGLSLLS